MMIFVLGFIALWCLGLMVTLKLEAAMCDHPTDYSCLLNPGCVVFWPVVAVLYLKTKHAARSIAYSKDRIEIIDERWVH